MIMGAIGDVLPLALGIAISPIPIIAAILMLLSPKARGTSVGFLGGWVTGILVAVVVFTLLGAAIPAADPDASQPIGGVIKLVLGALLVLLAVRQWRGRPRGDDQASLPTWMSAIDSMTPVRALALGFVLAAVNPKNLLLAASAGVSVGTAGLSDGEVVVTLAVFVVLAASSVLVPVVGYLAASTRMAAPLERLRSWLVQNNATVMSVLLLVIGVVVIGKGIASFS
jgi:threonine/homoserine/homoserine lactone efflux protein